jgi:hypothetical protein
MLQVCLNGSRRRHEKAPVTLTQIAERPARRWPPGPSRSTSTRAPTRGRETSTVSSWP